MIPDLGTMRDKARGRFARVLYGIMAFGWRGSARHWSRYQKAYLIFAGLATPLVISVHTVVSFDFAVAQLPGWHSTIFPPYFVAGAIFSGFAMVVTVLVFVRKVFDLENIITINHLDNMNKVILLTGSMVGYAYATEFFMAWYSGNPFELFVFINRAFGPYAWAYWIMISCNVLFPQLFWFRKIRRSVPVMLVIAILVNVGMWFERYVIIITSLHRDYLPSSWGIFIPTIFDIGILVGSFGLFFTLIILFTKSLPVVSLSEVKAMSEGAQPSHHGGIE